MRKAFTKNRLLLFLIAVGFICLAPKEVIGQVNMVRSTFTGPYTAISTGTGATLSTAVGDDVSQANIPIGFTFNYLGTAYTTIGVNTNGVAAFTGITTSGINTNLFLTTTPNTSLAPWWDDLSVAAGTGEILYQTQGAPGSQTFTIQWTNANSYYITSTTRLNFQLILFEGTDVIEFRYGTVTPGAVSINESASIGIENATGGVGNYLDGVTGSKSVGHGFLDATNKWPVRHIRFTPGTTTPMPAGTYTVGVGQAFPTLDEAVANLNHRGVAGPIIFNLVDPVYSTAPSGGDNIFPVIIGPVAGTSLANNVQFIGVPGVTTLSYDGAAGGSLVINNSTTSVSTTTEPILGLAGADFIGVQGLTLSSSATGVVDRGIGLVNVSGTDGATNNAFQGLIISLNRGNTSSIGIEQRMPTTPTAATGANSNNLYGDISISNVYTGVFLSGNATFPDLNCRVTTSSPTGQNLIGAATANDIGNGANASYGIRATNQSSVIISNTKVQNVGGTSTTDGIFLELAQGNSEIKNCIVTGIRNTSTTSTSSATGIRANVASTGTHIAYVFNNFVSGITSAYTGAGTANRVIRGIMVQSAGGGAATSNIFVDNNSVSIDGSAAPGVTNSCFEIGTTSGPIITARNNIFANFTTGQTVQTHSGWYSTSATSIGNTGSVSNFNDIYIMDATNGFTGTGNTTGYATLANWQTAMTSDANSVAVAPSFNNNVTDLHTTAFGINNLATPVAWVTTDIDNQARSATTPDIGADEFAPVTVDMSMGTLISPTSGNCYTSSQQVSVSVINNGLTPMDFTVNPCTVNVAITGATTANLQFIINNNSINGGPLAIGASIVVPVGTFNMSAQGLYTFNYNLTATGDGNSGNNVGTPVNINYSIGTISVNRTSICDGDTVRLTLTGNTMSAIQFEVSTNLGATWSSIAGATSSPYFFVPSDTSMFRASACGNLLTAVSDTVFWSGYSTPVVFDDTVCGLDTLHFAATGNGTISWYDQAVGGTRVNQGNTFDVVSPSTVTYYVTNTSGGGISTVGPLTNTIGAGGQQTSTAYNIFDVFTPCTLQGAYVYPGAAGNVVINLSNSAGTILQTVTYPVTAGDVGNRTYVPLNLNLSPGVGFRLGQGAGSVSMFRNSGGVTFPYTIPAISIYNSSAGTGFYYFCYDWQILTGCESARVPVTGIVNTPPAIAAVSTMDTICIGESPVLSVSSANTGYSYTWSPSTGLSGTTGSSVTATPTSSIAYVVEALDAAGCLIRDTLDISVNIHPTGVFSASDSLICIGDTVSLGLDAPIPSFTDSTIVPIIDNTPSGSYGYLTVSGFPGNLSTNSIATVCFDATHTWDGDMVFTLISPQGTQFVLTANNGGSGDNFINTCFDMNAATAITAGTAPFTGSFVPQGAGGFASFNGQNPNGQWSLWMVDQFGGDTGQLNWWSMDFNLPTLNYSWSSTPAGFSASTPNVMVTPTVTTDYMVTIADSATGCDTTYSYTVTVNPALAASITGPSVACQGDVVSLVGNASGGNGSYLYFWNGVAGTGSSTLTLTADTTLILTVMDTCSTPMASDTLTITVALPLGVSISGGSSVCEGQSITLNAVVSGGDGNNVYSWSNSGTTSSITVSPAITTTYTVSVTDGCTSTPVTASQGVTVNPLAIAAFSSSITGNLSYAFSNSSTNATTYAWNFGDGNTSTAQNPTHTYAASGNYNVCLIATNSCGSDTTCSSLTVVANAVAFGNGAVQLWPNPNNGQFNVRVQGLQGGDLHMELYNVNGQKLVDKQFQAVFDTLEERFELVSTKGVYFLKLNDGTNQATLRFVVQ